MNLPGLYTTIRRPDVLHHTFPRASPLLVDATGELGWWMSDDALICFANVEPRGHASADSSFFTSARSFAWVATAAHRSQMPGAPAIPRELCAKEAEGRTLFLFIRRAERDPFTFLGEAEPAYVCTLAPDAARATFELRRTVPSAVLWALGLDDEPPDTTALDAGLRVLADLILDARLVVLRQLVEHWHGPLRPEDGYSHAELDGVAMPKPLRWWFSVGGKRRAVFNSQNTLLEPDKLCASDGKLVYCVENQAVWETATLPDGDDPPVWVRPNETLAQWVREEVPLSIVLVQSCILEAALPASFGAAASAVEPAVVEAITRRLVEVGPPGWRFASFPARFFAAGGAFAFVVPYEDSDACDIWLGARTERPLSFLKEYDAALWDRADF